MVTLALLFSPSTTPLESCLFGPEIIENQLAVTAQGFGHLLHRLDARAHDLLAPVVEEPGGPGR